MLHCMFIPSNQQNHACCTESKLAVWNPPIQLWRLPYFWLFLYTCRQLRTVYHCTLLFVTCVGHYWVFNFACLHYCICFVSQIWPEFVIKCVSWKGCHIFVLQQFVSAVIMDLTVKKIKVGEKATGDFIILCSSMLFAVNDIECAEWLDLYRYVE